MTIFVFSDPPSSAVPCASTIGSLSTYTTRAPGVICCTRSCVLPWVGSPAPMSMNWRIPWSAIHRAARWWNDLFAQAESPISGTSALSRSPSSLSAAKLLVPPRK